MDRDTSRLLPATDLGIFRMNSTFYDQVKYHTIRLLIGDRELKATTAYTDAEVPTKAIEMLKDVFGPVLAVAIKG